MGDGRYTLTKRGCLAVQLLDAFPEKAVRKRGQKKTSKKLIAAALALLVGIIVMASLLITMSLQTTQPAFDVTYWKQQPESSNFSNFQYFFNVTGSHESFKLATSQAINQALSPYAYKYPFVLQTTSDGITYPYWTSSYVHNGQFSFTLLLQSPLTDAKLSSLTQDLKNALKSTQ